MRYRALLVAAGLLVAASGTAIADVGASYIGLRGSYAWREDTETSSGTRIKGASNTALGGSVVLGGSYGDLKGMGIRFELEAVFDSIRARQPATAPANGTREENFLLAAPMLNLVYDLPVSFPVRPYVGVGIGGASNDFSNFKFAYQAMAGIRWAASRDAVLGIGYRYMPLPNLGFHFTGKTQPDLKFGSSAVEVSFDYLLP